MSYILEHIQCLVIYNIIVLSFDCNDYIVEHNLQIVRCLQILQTKKIKIETSRLFLNNYGLQYPQNGDPYRYEINLKYDQISIYRKSYIK